MTSGRRVLRNGLAVTVVSLVVVGCGTDPAGLGRWVTRRHPPR